MEPQEQSPTLSKKIIGGICIIASIVGVGAYIRHEIKEGEFTFLLQEETTPAQPRIEQTTSETVTTQAGTLPTPSQIYKDGTFSAQGSYTSPAGNEIISLTVTLTKDTVTQATFTGNADNKASIYWQQKFNDGFSQLVVGKKISDVTLNIVNGSSLTPQGWNDAVSKIKNEAKL